MGDINQSYFLEKELPKKTYNNVLDIGSKDYGNTQSFRDLIQYNSYVGVDMEAGKNVDHVIDLTKTIEPLKENIYDLIICCSVLEHVEYPWIFADNVSKLSSQNGLLYMAVPFVWKFHGYPNDYYRYTHNGIKKLFKNYKWNDCYFSTFGAYNYFKIEDDRSFSKSITNLSTRVENKKFSFLNKQMVNNKLGIDLKDDEFPQKALSYIQILMIGEKK